MTFRDPPWPGDRRRAAALADRTPTDRLPDLRPTAAAAAAPPGPGRGPCRRTSSARPVTGEEVPEDLLIDLVSAEWVDERRKRWA